MENHKKFWIMVSAYYGRKLDDITLTMYAEDSRSLELDVLSTAFSIYRRNPKNRQMPLPGALLDIVNPKADETDQARNIVGKIVESVARFGYMRGEEARGYIGPIGWESVVRSGGWNYICQNLGVKIDITHFHAQTRELIKSQIKCMGNRDLELLGNSDSIKRIE